MYQLLSSAAPQLINCRTASLCRSGNGASTVSVAATSHAEHHQHVHQRAKEKYGSRTDPPEHPRRLSPMPVAKSTAHKRTTFVSLDCPISLISLPSHGIFVA